MRLFRVGFCVTLQTHTNSVPLTFPWHRLCSTDHKTFFFFYFSLSSNGLPNACFLCFLSEEQNHHEKRAKQRIQTLWEHRKVLCSRVFFEKSEKLWFGSLMSILSSSTEVILSNFLGSQPVFASDFVSKTSHCAINDDTVFMNQTAMDDRECDRAHECLRKHNTETETEWHHKNSTISDTPASTRGFHACASPIYQNLSTDFRFNHQTSISVLFSHDGRIRMISGCSKLPPSIHVSTTPSIT